jgi:hypothetical protein
MNATVTVTGIELSASNLPLPDTSSWFDWYYERNLDTSAGALTESGALQLDADNEPISATGFAEVQTGGIELSADAGEVLTSGNANKALDGFVATSSAEEISGTGGAVASVNSAELGSEFGTVSVTGDAQSEVNGLELESETGTVIGVGQFDGLVSLSGVELVSSLGDINTSVLNPDIIQVSGGSGRYSPQAFKNGFVKVAGVRTKITLGDVKSFGVVSIAARVNVQSVEMDLQAQTIAAEGILSIGDEELMLLLAA